MKLLKCKNIGEGMVECAEFPRGIVKNISRKKTESIIEK